MRKIVYEEQFKNALLDIVSFIAKDKISASTSFKKGLKVSLEHLIENPKMYKHSLYFKDDCYRDMTYKGYTVIYKIEEDLIKVLDIFKWVNR